MVNNFLKGELVQLKAPLPKSLLTNDEALQVDVLYTVHGVEGDFLLFDIKDHRRDGRLHYLPYASTRRISAHSHFFKSVALGRKASVTTQIAALSSVHGHFQEPEKRKLKRKIQETTLEMERSSMTAEDEPTEREKKVRRLYGEAMFCADFTLSKTRRDIRLALEDSKTDYQAALKATSNAVCYAERKLDEFDYYETLSNFDDLQYANTHRFQAHHHFFKSAPLSNPKDSVNSVTTTAITALGFVYQHFQESENRSLKRKLEETTLEMERASMAAEYKRAESNETLEKLCVEFISPAKLVLSETRRKIRLALEDSKADYHLALIEADNAVREAEKQLGELGF